ncbi:MAG: dynamin family protein [Actinomycetota bacterium]
MATDDPAGLAEALRALADALGSTPLALDVGPAATGRTVRTELVDQIDDYLLPRLQRLDAPLLVVIGGSTGSGKSTITNTVVGREVSPAGVLRPTTRSPVLICHPDDQDWFAGSDVLPGLARQTGDVGDAEPTPTGDADRPTANAVLRLVADDGIGPGIGILDAPDIDSIEDANRDLATQLLAAADLWLFTTTAMRYADAVPWDFLHQARDRGTSLAVIINRIPPGASAEVVPHLRGMLADRGLPDIEVFPVTQTELADGRLPTDSVAGVRTLLDGLAADAERRAQVIRTTLDGALASVGPRARDVAVAARAQTEAASELAAAVDGTYGRSVDRLVDDISSGNLLRGEVLDRWQELVGTAELMQAVQSRISLLRDRIGAFLRGRPAATAEVKGEITSTLETLLIDHADAAASGVADRWRDLPGGRQVLDGDRALERSSERYRETVGAEIRAWQDDILELVRQRGAGKRTTARILAFSINSVGIALMLVLFSQTAGLSGGELAIGAGTAGLSQTLLSALFGEQAVRELANEARQLLITRVGNLLDQDAARFHGRLGEVAGVDPTGVHGPDGERGGDGRDLDPAERLERAIGAIERTR